MKIQSVLRLLTIIALAGLLAAGCAKKPAADQAAADAAAATPTTEMTAEDVSGVDEQGITEEAVTDRGMAEDEVIRTEPDVGMERIFFAFDQYTLTAEARETLAGNADYLEQNPGLEVRIEGHCDERGSDEYNLALGERRAMAAQNYLVSLGVDEDRLSTISYGEEMPLDPGRGEEAWAKNRRAEFKIVR